MSEDDQKCCNPFGIHSKGDVTTGLRLITQSNVLKYPALNLMLGKYWCGYCRTRGGPLSESESKPEESKAPCRPRQRFSLQKPSTSRADSCPEEESKPDQTDKPVVECCNPYKTHKIGVSKNLRKINDKDAARVWGLVVGEFWCTACRTRKVDLPLAASTSEVATILTAPDPTQVPSDVQVQEVPEKFCCNPLKIHKGKGLFVTKNLKQISEEDSEKMEGLMANKWWCNYCRLKVLSQDQALLSFDVPSGSTSENQSSVPDTSLLGIDFSSIIVSVESMDQSATESTDVCCDPFSLHSGEDRTKSLRYITTAHAEQHRNLEGRDGQKWCSTCRQFCTSSSDFLKCTYSTGALDNCSGSVRNIRSLNSDEEKALSWNAGVWEGSSKDTVCDKHFQKYVGYITTVAPVIISHCCNPLKSHRKGTEVVTDLVNISLCGVLRAKEKNILLRYGEKYCKSCRDQIKDLDCANLLVERQGSGLSLGSSSHTSSHNSPAVTPKILRVQVQEALANLGVSHVESFPNSKARRICHAKKMIQNYADTAKKSICRAIALNQEEVKLDNEMKAQCFDDLMAAVKCKLSNANRAETYQLLTLYPPSMSVREGSEFFGVSRTLLNVAARLREEKGILASPSFERTPLVCQKTRELIVSFYCDDRYSKLMPGTRDVVSLGNGKYEQKRLILSNLHELYSTFKLEYSSHKVGFSFFCSLRPKWCVTAGARGIHSVCCCQTHQDMKLIFHALHVKDHYRDIIKLCVCDHLNRMCMVRICSNCPKRADIHSIIEEKVLAWKFPSDSGTVAELAEENKSEFLEEEVEYCRWKSTDRAEMINIICSRGELISAATEQMLKLIPHDYVARSQAEYLKQLKEKLPPSTAIISMDFGMNYSCLIQGEIQSYHWSKTQVTNHPVVIHINVNGSLQHRTIMFISDDLDHDTYLVQEIQNKVIAIVKTNYPTVTHVEYQTDGCGAQYKNKKGFLYLCEHKKNHGITAKHNFYATSHGKSQCDAASASMKRKLLYASLQRHLSNQIINAQHVYDFCVTSDLGMDFIFIKKADVDKIREAARLEPELAAVPGTRSFHQYIPLTDDIVECRFTSFDTEPALMHCLRGVSRHLDFNVGSFVVAKVVRRKFIGYVTDTHEEDGEVELSLLHPKLPANIFTWVEDNLNTIVVPLPHVIVNVSMTELEDNRYSLTEQSKNMLIARRVIKP